MGTVAFTVVFAVVLVVVFAVSLAAVFVDVPISLGAGAMVVVPVMMSLRAWLVLEPAAGG